MKILLSVLLLLAIPILIGYASAQSIPLPPPFPENGSEKETIAENDHQPPKIEIMTTELHDGINVFRVKITDDSSLRVREVKYVQDGQLKVDGLFRDQNDIYKALIDIESPSRLVVVNAGDANGNIASAYREYDISPSEDPLSQIIDMLSQIPRYVQNMLGL